MVGNSLSAASTMLRYFRNNSLALLIKLSPFEDSSDYTASLAIVATPTL